MIHNTKETMAFGFGLGFGFGYGTDGAQVPHIGGSSSSDGCYSMLDGYLGVKALLFVEKLNAGMYFRLSFLLYSLLLASIGRRMIVSLQTAIHSLPYLSCLLGQLF